MSALPGGDRAIVPVEKLTGYCLSETNEEGKHKARVFRSALRLTAADAEVLHAALLAAAVAGEAVEREPSEYGRRFNVDFNMVGPGGPVTVRSAWIVRNGEDFPRLTTCYVLR